MLLQIDRIQAELAQPARADANEVRAALRGLAEQLREHEAAEEALLLEVWLDNAGAGD